MHAYGRNDARNEDDWEFSSLTSRVSRFPYFKAIRTPAHKLLDILIDGSESSRVEGVEEGCQI